MPPVHLRTGRIKNVSGAALFVKYGPAQKRENSERGHARRTSVEEPFLVRGQHIKLVTPPYVTVGQAQFRMETRRSASVTEGIHSRVPLTAYPLCVTRYADLGARYDRWVGLSSAIANLLVLRFAERLIEGITRAAPAEDRITFATGRQDFAKTSYVDIDGSIRDVSGSLPGALQKLLP
jgi:hypothetical protein